MKIPWPAASRANCQLTGQVCLGTSSEGSNFLMSDMQPFDFALATYGIGKAVEAVADDTVDPLDACNRQGLSELVRNSIHIVSPGSIKCMGRARRSLQAGAGRFRLHVAAARRIDDRAHRAVSGQAHQPSDLLNN